MDKKRRILVLSLIIGVFFVFLFGGHAVSIAAQITSVAGARDARIVVVERGRLTNLKGEITRVNADGREITIKTGEDKVTMSVTDKTIIAAGRIKRSFADLKVGDQVVVRITEEEGKNVAHLIRIARAR
ncbi:MAG: hypothetical protein ACE5HN_07480 [Nitrospiria bacterium]